MKRIAPTDVALGMFVQGFEGGWLSHPFWRSRFLLDDPADVEAIRASSVAAVLVDEAKSRPGLFAPAIIAPPAAASPSPAAAPIAGRGGASLPLFAPPPPPPPADPMSAADRARITRMLGQSKATVKALFAGARLGHTVRVSDVTDIVAQIEDEVDRNRTAFIGMTRLKSKHEYTFLHSVAVSALMVNLARELGLPPATVREMGLAGMLHDIGKMGVDPLLLDKPGALDDEEFALVRRHAEMGHAILSRGEGVPAMVLDVALHHHERMDGRGYPHRLPGDRLSQPARMGAICDVYDAVTSRRAYKEPWTPGDAIAAMAGWSGHFDEALFFAFMKSISVYPPGMLVRLRSNQLAIALPNGRRASRARMLVFYSIVERALIPPHETVLSDTLAGDAVISREDPDRWGLTDWPALRDRLMGVKAAA